MYNVFFVNVFILLFFSCSSSAQQEHQNIRHVDVAEFEAKMTDPDVVVLDVRTPQETQQGKIGNAIEIDFKSADFETEIAKLDKNKTYLVYCRSGNRSNQACQKMAAQGFEHLYNLKSGYLGWQKSHAD